MQSDKLPKMPAALEVLVYDDQRDFWLRSPGGHGDGVFSAEQMRDYALATRKAALEEVRAELERLYAELGDPLGGSYEAGQQTALDCFEGWVERLMEQDA